MLCTETKTTEIIYSGFRGVTERVHELMQMHANVCGATMTGVSKTFECEFASLSLHVLYKGMTY